MLISEAIARAAALTGQVTDNAAPVRWLSELDGRLAFEFYRADAWAPYDPADDLGCELLVPFPWDGFYVHHLEAMTYFSNGEYDRYDNARALAEQTLSDFRHFMQRTQAKLCAVGFPTEKQGGSGVTVIPGDACHSPWFWLSAYALAVKHGYKGTEDEWIDEQRQYVDAALASASAASASADAAQTSAETASAAAASAAGDAQRAADSVLHPPRVSAGGTWEVWTGSAYLDTGAPSRGPAGPQGAQGPEGPPGAAVAVETQGMYWFSVDGSGDLILTYTGDTAPDFSIDGETGHLLLTM